MSVLPYEHKRIQTCTTLIQKLCYVQTLPTDSCRPVCWFWPCCPVGESVPGVLRFTLAASRPTGGSCSPSPQSACLCAPRLFPHLSSGVFLFTQHLLLPSSLCLHANSFSVSFFFLCLASPNHFLPTRITSLCGPDPSSSPSLFPACTHTPFCRVTSMQLNNLLASSVVQHAQQRRFIAKQKAESSHFHFQSGLRHTLDLSLHTQKCTPVLP